MATIQQTIALADGVSPVLNRIGRAVDQTIGRFYRAADAATGMEQAAAAGANEVSSAVGISGNAMQRLGIIAENVNNKIQSMGRGAFSGLRNALPGISGQLNNAFSVIAGPVGISGNAMQRLGVVAENVNNKIQSMGRGAFLGLRNALPGISGQLNNAFSVIDGQSRRVASSIMGTGAAAMRAKNYIISAMTASTGAIRSMGPVIDSINNKLRNTGNGAFSGLKNALSGMMGQITVGNLLADVIMRVGNTIMQIPGNLMRASDEYANIQARLNLVTGSATAAAEMNEKIFKSAIRARGIYENMADSVAKIAMTAKEAFPNPADVVPFVEEIQKLFVIGGTSAEQAKNAMLQLTQALGSGRLQGDEFRSIAESAPLIEQMVAKTMGVSQGALKQLASEGKVTADVIKQAIFENMDEIDELFSNMPMTWSQKLAVLGSDMNNSFNEVKAKLNELANSEFVNKISGMLVVAANWAAQAVLGIINNIQWAFSVIQQNWGIIEPIMMGLAIALLGIAINSAIAAAGHLAMAAAAELSALSSFMMTAATIAEIYAVEGLSAALYACPLTWIIGLIVLLVAAFYGAVAVVNHFAGTSISATGLIFGAFAWLFTNIINYIKLMANVFIAFANFLGSVFKNPLDAAYNLFVDIWNAISEYVAQAINGIIDMIKKIPGIDKVLGDVGHVEFQHYERRQIEGALWEIKPFEYGNAAYNAEQAYDFGANGINFELPDLGRPDKPEILPFDTGAIENGDLGKSAKDTAGNTGRMAETEEITAEELKYLRDLANQEAINRYTTASVNIDMGGISNNISSDIDVDGLITYMSDSLVEAMQAGAEEVHPT